MGQLSGHRLPLLWCDSSLRWNDHIKRDPDGPVTRVDLCCALAACHGLVVNSTPQKYTGEVHFSRFFLRLEVQKKILCHIVLLRFPLAGSRGPCEIGREDPVLGW